MGRYRGVGTVEVGSAKATSQPGSQAREFVEFPNCKFKSSSRLGSMNRPGRFYLLFLDKATLYENLDSTGGGP